MNKSTMIIRKAILIHTERLKKLGKNRTSKLEIR